ncbi:MAG TPA: hypothetical protein P5116_08110 [Eubacteriales bacterium]|nr:hypothetical protein [Clostridia bacterium]HRV73822.1 hypothetical protein [Eubacteriales bacterium]
MTEMEKKIVEYTEKVCESPVGQETIKEVITDMNMNAEEVNPLLTGFYADGRKPADYDCKER